MDHKISILNLAQNILRHLDLLKRPVASRFQDGLPRQVIDTSMSDICFVLTEEAQHLYRWKDGTDIKKGDRLDDLHFFPGYYWLSLQDALSTYRILSRSRSWNPVWFPLFANGGGDYYAIVSQGPPDGGAIVGFLSGEQNHNIEYLSLPTMFATINACYEEQVFYVTPEGYLQTNDVEQMNIARRYNQGLDFYSERGRN